MSVLTLILIIALLPLTLARLLRWLAWSQQKEYRPDRLWHFLRSEEGLQELLRVIPTRADFSRTGLKRPVITLRSALTGFVSLIMLGFVLSASYTFQWWWLPIASYVLVPVFPGLVGFVTELLKTLVSLLFLFLAKQKLLLGKPTIIGITGSYGKTTTRHLIAHVLSQQLSVFTPQKSHNTPLSTAWSILKGYAKESIAFLEFAAYKKGEIKHLAWWFPPTVSIVTGVTPQHLALFGSVENIIKAKGELVKATKLDGVVFYNGSDDGALKICEEDPSKRALAYAGPASTVLLGNTHLDHKGRFHCTWQAHEIHTHLIGLHNANAVQAAIAVALHFNVPEAKIRAGLVSFLPTENYIMVYPHHQQKFLIINDGRTSNPMGFHSALDVLTHFKKAGRNTVLITGGILDLGTQSDEIHLELAKAAKKVCDLVLYTGVDGQQVFKEVFGTQMTDHQATIQSVIDQLNENDVLLIEGNLPVWLIKQLKRKL